MTENKKKTTKKEVAEKSEANVKQVKKIKAKEITGDEKDEVDPIVAEEAAIPEHEEPEAAQEVTAEAKDEESVEEVV